ncbi:MAG: Zn-ribbon domain-containing OB-fold protein [Candidatus Hadarchaeales archaeon]
MHVPRFWREIPNRYTLIGTKCGHCEKIFFPPRAICPNCRRVGHLEPFKLSGRGRVYSFTTVYAGPRDFKDQIPYVLAIIELEEGPRVMAQITDCNGEEVKIGDEVEMVFRKIKEEGEEGIIYYGFKARLVRKKEASDPSGKG